MANFRFWDWEDPDEQRKRHAADFANIAADIQQKSYTSQVQEHVGGLLEQARGAASRAWGASAPEAWRPGTEKYRRFEEQQRENDDGTVLGSATGALSRVNQTMSGVNDLLLGQSVNVAGRFIDEMAGTGTIGQAVPGIRENLGDNAADTGVVELGLGMIPMPGRAGRFVGAMGGLGNAASKVKIAGAVFGAGKTAAASQAAQAVSNSYGKATPGVDLNLKRFVYEVFDDLAPVRDMMDGLAGRLGRALHDNENAYEILRLGRATNEIGDSWFRQFTEPALKGLDQISGGIAQGRKDLNDYLRAVDAIDKDAIRPGRNYGGFTAQQAQQALTDMQARLGPQAYQQLEQAAKSFHDLGHFLLQKKVDAGLVSQQLATDMMQKYPRYMPIQVIDWLDDNLSRTSARVGKVGGAANDIKSLTDFGTTRAAEEPIQAFYRLSQRTAMMEAKNKAGLAIVDAAQSDPILQGLVRKVTHGVQRLPGEELLQIRRNGDIEKYYVDRALKPLVEYGVTVGPGHWDNVVKPFMKAADITRKAAIAYNPTWGVGQFVMDSLGFLIKEGGVAGGVGKNLGYLGEGLKEAVIKGNVYREAARSGALPGVAEFASGKPGSYDDIIKGMVGRDITKPSELVKWIGSGLRSFNETLDAAPRLAEYARVRDLGGTAQKAALAARDVTIDPSRGGHIIRQYNAVVPFFNVAFQGAAYLPRLLTNKDPDIRKKAMLGVTTSVIMPSMALEAMNDRDPRYKDVPDFDKNRGFIIMAPWGEGKKDPVTGEDRPNYFLVRTGPFTPFVLMGRAMAREGLAASGMTQNGGADWEKFGTGMLSSTSPVDVGSPVEAFQSGENLGQSLFRTGVSMMPAGMRQVGELAANYDTFRDKPIIPKGLENQPAERQFSEKTSETAKLIGAGLSQLGLNVAPAQIDYLMKAWGGATEYAVGVADSALDLTGIAAKGESQRLTKLRRDLAKTGITDEEKARLEGEIARELLIKADREGSLKNTPIVGGLIARYYREGGGQTIEDRGKKIDEALLSTKRDTSPRAKELERLGVSISDVKDEIGGVKLTRTQAATYRENALTYRQKLVDGLMQEDYYKSADDKEKGRLLKDAMQRAAGWASQEVLPGRSDVGAEFDTAGGIDNAVKGYLNAQRAKTEYGEIAKNERFRNIDPEDYEETVRDIGELQKLKAVLGEDEGEMVFLEKYGELRFARASTAKESKRWRDRSKQFKEDNPDYVMYIDSAPRTFTRRGLKPEEVARLAGL